MKKLTLVTLLAMGVGASQIAQAQSFTDYAWQGDMMAAPAIPDEFKDAEAVIYKSETYNSSKFAGTYPYLEGSAVYRSQMHVKLQSQKAVDEFKRLAIPRFRGRIGDYVQMKFVDVRVRRADGKVEDLTVRNLPVPTLTPDDDLYDQQEDLFIYEIPNLNIGDELERVTVLEAKFPDQGRTINLYTDYPTLETKLVLAVPKKVKILGSVYNLMPAPTVKNLANEQVEYSWTIKNLRGVPEANSQGTISTEKLEYLIYEINLDAFRAEQSSVEVKNFADLLWQYAEDFLTVTARKAKMEEFYLKVFEGKTELSQVEKLFYLNQFVAQKLKIVGEGDLEESERGQNLEYFVFNKKATPSVVMQLYRHFFDTYGFTYKLAFGKNRFLGPIDLNFPSQTQVSDYFFIVNTDDGKQLVVEGTGGINELPSGFWGTTCYFRDLGDRKAGLNKIDFGKETLEDSKNNKRLRRAQWEIKTATGEINQKVGIELKGLYAGDGRGGWVTANKADTLTKAVERSFRNLFKGATVVVNEAVIKQHDIVPPYDFKTSFGVQVSNWAKVDNGVMVLDLKKWWLHNIRYVSNPEKRTLDYHLPYLGSDVEDLVLVFDKDVELSNISELQQKVDNSYATYECKVTQLNSKTIRVESRYTLKKLFIPASEAKLLDEANKAFEKVAETKLNIKIK